VDVHRVLIVDDDPDIVDYISSFLKDNGYQVATAGNATEAMSTIEQFEPHVVLIDVLMPGKSGLDLLVSLRKSPRWSDLPLVVVTGNDQILQDDCQSYVGIHEGVQGPDGVLGKPVDRGTLLKMLEHLART